MNIKQRVNDLFNKYSVALSAVENDTPEQAVALASATLENGTEIKTDAEAFEVGVEAYVENEEGEKITLPDGSYVIDNGTELIVTDGVISEITEAETEEEVEEIEAKDKEEELSEEPLTREAVSEMIVSALEGFETELNKIEKQHQVEMSEVKLAAATQGIQRSPAPLPVVPVDLSTLTTKQRVSHLYNQFSA